MAIEMYETVIKSYLLLVILGGVYGVTAGLIVVRKRPSNTRKRAQIDTSTGRWKTLIRGFSTLVIGLCFSFFFLTGRLHGWTIFLFVAVLLIAQEYLLTAICSLTAKKFPRY